MAEKTKIRACDHHLAYVNSELLYKAMRKAETINVSSYITDIIFSQYHIFIKSKPDITKLQQLVIEDYYDDVGEFLEEKMREELRK